MVNRLILWVALAGMILTIHTWVQKTRGFDQGCLGLETHAVAPADGGCNAAALQAGSQLFGISNAAWGYAFYFALAVLSFAKIVVPALWSRRLHALGEISVAVALLYSGYLLYFQAFVAGAFCVLCLMSCALVIALAALHFTLRRRGGYQPLSEAARTAEIGLAGGALFAGMGVLVAVLVFVNRLGTRGLDQGGGAVEMRRIVGRALPAFIDPKKLDEMRSCHFDGLASPLDLKKFIEPTTPFLGKPDGVPVIVFSDPHCVHCRELHARCLSLVAKYQDRARFYFLPRSLWEHSIAPVAALKLAERSGKYFDLWKLQFERPPRTLVTQERLAEFYQQLGLEMKDLAARLEAVRPQVLADRAQAAAAGIDSLPAIFIDGRQVFASDLSEPCLGNLIEDALAAYERVGARTTRK